MTFGDFMKRPMLYVAISVILLSVFSFYLGKTVLLIPIGLIFIALSFIFFKSFYQTLIIAGLIALFTIVSITETAKIENMDSYSNYKFDLKLVATEDSERYGTINRVTVKNVSANKFADEEKFVLTYYGYDTIEAGEKFKALVQVQSLKNDEYKASWYSQDVYAQLKLIEYRENLGCNKFYSGLQDIRDFITSTINSSMSEESAATMCGITVGDKDYFTDEFETNVRASGVSHVMVVSGLHLAIILGGFFSLIEKICYNKYLKLFLSVGAVFALVAICGFTVSVIRAGIMFIIAALAPVVGRDNDPLSSLSTAFCIIMLSSPFAVFSVSLQLSALATFGIVVIAPFYNNLIFEKFKIKNYVIKELISIPINTLSATIMTMPIIVKTFGEISLVSPITNILITYAVSYALTINCIALALSLVPVLNIVAKLLFWIVDILATYINTCINYFGTLEFATLETNEYYLYFSIAIIILLLLIIYACKSNLFLLQSNKKMKGDK